MIIDIKELNGCDFSISQIYSNKNVMKSKKTLAIQQARCNIIYIFEGKITFKIGEDEISFGADSAIYFPGAYLRKMTIEEETCYYRIDFYLMAGEEVALFSNTPCELKGFSPIEARAAIKELDKVCETPGNKLLRHEKICKLLWVFANTKKNPPNPKIKPAIDYLNTYYTKKVKCRDLAKMCFLSTAQFYNLFNEQFEMTPLEYRNLLLTERAKELLSTTESTVAEIADMLGFSDMAYFSRFFKKQTGTSPATYARGKSYF